MGSRLAIATIEGGQSAQKWPISANSYLSLFLASPQRERVFPLSGEFWGENYKERTQTLPGPCCHSCLFSGERDA